MKRTALGADIVDIHLIGGTLLIGRRTDPDVSFWQKKLRQDRLSFHVIHHLQRAEHAAAGRLRLIADRLGILSYSFHAPDHVVMQTVLRAIDTGQAAAVFLPNHLTHLQPAPPPRTQGPARSVVTRSPGPVPARPLPAAPAMPRPPILPQSGSVAVSPRPDIARMTKVQRIEEMLGRVPDLITEAGLKSAFLALVSPESLRNFAMSLAAWALAHAAGIGEIIDAGLIGLAYYYAGIAGMWAGRDLIAAVKDAAEAQTEPAIEKAAALFAGAVIVLGTTVITVGLLHKGRSGGGKVPKEEEVATLRPSTSRQRIAEGESSRLSTGDKQTSTNPFGIPEHWTESQTEGVGGRQWVNPENSGDSVRLMPGNPESQFPNSRNPYIRDVRDGNKWLSVDGSRMEGRVGRYSEDTHIPADTYNFK